MPGTLRRGQRLVIASHNQGKVQEMAELLAPFGVETMAASTLKLAEPEETGASFAENAKLKAAAAAKASGLPALADDSGLAVASLGGEPGIHSARWGGPAKDFALAMARVNRELEMISARDRSAKFICALALATQDGSVDVFEGEVSGTLVWPPRGTKGFGYDPIFVPEGFEETFGEMEPEMKHAMSHRACAFEELMLATYEDDDDE
jgi:XTP/dITP diphosphohydrolase